MHSELPKTKIDERTGIEYHLEGDYYIPNLVMPEQENITLNKYGRMRLNYLKENKKAEYSIMLMDGTLNKYLHDIDEECENKLKKIMNEFIKQENITEELKANNQMEWVQAMNSIKNRAEEIILNEVIYM